MRVAQKLIDYQASLAFLPRDANLNFLVEISHHPKQQKYMDLVKLKHLIKILQEKFNGLDLNQQEEWQSNIINKVSCLLKRYISTKDIFILTNSTSEPQIKRAIAIRQSLYTLVYICVISQIQYDSSRAQQLIKQFYFREYGEQILFYFQSVGYDISQYSHLYFKRCKVPYGCCQQNIEQEDSRLD